ncbi:Twin-arginine translocation pathway signal sequence domain-containing protein [Caballeronia novacaledonica]|uniref:Twin-arginine translocation pathway signal sequence domain-containing protein n=1 Tax=Caballeronia novacaledonica TaxID=1544861 RepID=A0A2U3I8G7_9BURK|nr:DUF1501 domain-containing protein [Caballeronia novacaledonica]SPB16417.1 Twin-arginine translocation pathway signal sequence domain-containing protein [Caballeronia novacaledonica]
MNRRHFLSLAGAFAGLSGSIEEAFAIAHSGSTSSIRSLVIVDLDGGNDGLNTVIPIADPRYRALRPSLAISKNHALTLDERTALHPSLLPLMDAWRANELAIVQGVGYDAPNRSHYRSRQIWETASHANEYRADGWLDRLNAVTEVTTFKAAGDALARGVNVIRVALYGFDTHENQGRRHAACLARLAEGLASLRASLVASGAWDRALVMTRSEFGRAARENAAGGTEHGAASAHFVMGGGVRGGLFGMPPRLDRLDADGGLPVGIDFRRLYATVLDACWKTDSASILGTRFEPLPILRV